MAVNNDIIALLNTIRGEMATKSDIARLHREVATLRAENEVQRSQLRSLRCLNTDIASLRTEVEDLRRNILNEMWAEVEDLKTKFLDEMWDGIEETKEEVVRCCVSTQQEIWAEAREIKNKVRDMEDGFARLAMKDAVRDEEAEEVNEDLLRVVSRIERVEEKLNAMADACEAPRKDSGVSVASEEKQKKTKPLWFANGY